MSEEKKETILRVEPERNLEIKKYYHTLIRRRNAFRQPVREILKMRGILPDLRAGDASAICSESDEHGTETDPETGNAIVQALTLPVFPSIQMTLQRDDIYHLMRFGLKRKDTVDGLRF